MTRVLVTGSSGFLGSELAARLITAGHQIAGLDPVPARTTEYPNVTDDLSDVKSLTNLLGAHKITHIIHAGGVSGPMVLSDRPDLVMEINVAGSLNLLRAAFAAGVKTFLYCSSVSSIGEYYEDQPIGIDRPMQPVHPYGCSKAAVEMVLRGLWKRVSLDLCALRFTTIYGPGRQTSWVLDEVVTAVVQNRSIRVTLVTDWPYIFIDDAVEATIAACFSERRSQLAYYIAHPQQVSLAAIGEAAAAAGFPVQLDIADGPPVSARGPVDIGPAQRDFDFTPQVDYREGIRRMIASRLASSG